MTRRIALSARVTGPAAMWLMRRSGLEAEAQDAVRYFRSGGRPDVAAAIERAMQELREAGQQWLEAAQHPADVSGAGSAETEISPDDASLERGLLNAAAAGRELGVSSRRVRQLIDGGSLAGTWNAGRWLVEKSSVDELRTRREMTR